VDGSIAAAVLLVIAAVVGCWLAVWM